MAGQLDSEGARHRHHCGFRRSIGRIARRPLDAGGARHHDKRSSGIAGLGAFAHMLGGFPQRPEYALEIYALHAAKRLCRHLCERRGAADAGIGDHAVDPAKLCDRRQHAIDHFPFFADVHLARQNASASRAQHIGRGVIFPLVEPPDRDVGAGLRERIRHRQSDAAIAPCDQRDFSGQVEGLVHRLLR